MLKVYQSNLAASNGLSSEWTSLIDFSSIFWMIRSIDFNLLSNSISFGLISSGILSSRSVILIKINRFESYHMYSKQQLFILKEVDRKNRHNSVKSEEINCWDERFLAWKANYLELLWLSKHNKYAVGKKRSSHCKSAVNWLNSNRPVLNFQIKKAKISPYGFKITYATVLGVCPYNPEVF